MKRKISISIEEGYIDFTKHDAEDEGRTLSNYIENLLYANMRSYEVFNKNLHDHMKEEWIKWKAEKN